jgi:hypothetical protein
MKNTGSINPLEQYCLDNLQKMLDLAMHTAEAASAAGNHKVVLQAVREVTRMVTLITKLASLTPKKIAKAPDSLKILAGPAPAAETAALSNDPVQDVLKFFPGLSSEPKISSTKLTTQDPLFWQRSKGGKKRHKAGR